MISAELEPLSPWHRAQLCLALVACEPRLGGLWLRARVSPVRDRFLSDLPVPLQKIHPQVTDDALFGAMDVGATLATGRVTRSAGMLATSDWLCLTMAERCEPGLAARLGHAVDGGAVVLALDEGLDGDGPLPASLADRLAFQADLDGIRLAEATPLPRLNRVTCAPFRSVLLTQILEASAAFGVFSARTLQQAVLTARTHAGLHGRSAVAEADILRALELVIAPRATRVPTQAEAPEDPADAPPPLPDTSHEGDDTRDAEIPQDILLEAIKAALPTNLLARLAAEKAAHSRASSAGTGSKIKGNRRGRPLAPRQGRPRGDNRIDLFATLRAAAPWQPLRHRLAEEAGRPVPAGTPVLIRQSDVRTKRYESRSDRLLVFAVDASGSSAVARLAEAKGAIELLLAEAYARRDHVSLVAFRGDGAELLLPPTRSLVQTKRRLAALPGGGGTPLAAGLRTATEVGLQARDRGMTPTVALLTDGRANISLSGQANRTEAAEDATRMGRQLRALGLSSLVIDTGKRPAQALEALSATMGAPYVPLPRANAQRLSEAVSGALEG